MAEAGQRLTSDDGGPTSDDVRTLARWLLAALSDDRAVPRLPPSLAHLACCPAPVLRSGLITLARRAADSGLIQGHEVTTWSTAAGLYARITPRAEVAAAVGVSPSGVDRIRERVASAVATVWGEGVFTAAVRAPKPEFALARAHAEAAALAADPAADPVVSLAGQIRDTTLRLAATTRAPASAAERAARHRARQRLYARIAQESTHSLTAPALLLPVRDDLGVLDPDAARQFRRDRPDQDWLAHLVRSAQCAAATDPDRSRALALLATRGYARYDRRPHDWRSAATAWRLAIHHDLPRRDMGALWRLSHLRRLAPPDHPIVLPATIYVAQNLRANGYLGPASDLLHEVLRRVPTAPLSPAERDPLTVDALVAFSSSTPWSAGGEPTRDVVEMGEALRRAEHFLEVDRCVNATVWLVLDRRRFLAAHLRRVHAAKADGARRPRQDRATTAALESLIAQITGSHEHAVTAHDRAMGWWSVARAALDLHDRDTFGIAVQALRPLFAGPLRHYDFSREYAAFGAIARRRHWPELAR